MLLASTVSNDASAPGSSPVRGEPSIALSHSLALAGPIAHIASPCQSLPDVIAQSLPPSTNESAHTRPSFPLHACMAHESSIVHGSASLQLVPSGAPMSSHS